MLIFEIDQHVWKCTPKCKPIGLALALFSDSKYATAKFRCHGNRGSSETIEFHLGLYTVKLAEPENTMFGARIGGEVGEPLYGIQLLIQAELQPILCSNNNILPTGVGLR